MRNTMRVVSIKLPEELDAELTKLARRRNVTRSAVLREALETFARSGQRSVTKAARDLVGSLQGSSDLSASGRHMSGYGK
jgi:metal-responsive CopG/Arc/MetJ family transcriptional regulator